ncbi:MAG: DUF971 domain-containing protein [Alphaproteobacteria bacterium]|nr:DUF971 domain-containing protein [Alphaproteobacteria bacterium]
MNDRLTFKIWPKEIQLKKNEKKLFIEFDDGACFEYPAEYLRIESPSAEVKGHGSSQRKIISGCKNIGIGSIESVGNYAIRILFTDLHDTGIYSWDYLYTLGKSYEEKWHRYLRILEALGLSRD